MIDYRKAMPEDLTHLWDKNIADNPEDARWVTWKKEYIEYNARGMAATFAVLADGDPVGEGTLLFSPACGAVDGREALADGRTVANVNALRIQKAYEGKGYISALVRLMERYAAEQGYTRLTIGVEECESRNRAIYQHMGYTIPLFTEVEDGATVLYYAKDL